MLGVSMAAGIHLQNSISGISTNLVPYFKKNELIDDGFRKDFKIKKGQ